jgi:hypothetical protein
MSDFGTLLTVTKKDNSELTNSEVNDLSSGLKKIIKKGEFTDALGEPFEHDFVIDDDKKSAIVQLSEHYYGDDLTENEELFEFVENTEKVQIEEIIEKLKLSFPDFKFEAETEEW